MFTHLVDFLKFHKHELSSIHESLTQQNFRCVIYPKVSDVILNTRINFILIRASLIFSCVAADLPIRAVLIVEDLRYQLNYLIVEVLETHRL